MASEAPPLVGLLDGLLAPARLALRPATALHSMQKQNQVSPKYLGYMRMCRFYTSRWQRRWLFGWQRWGGVLPGPGQHWHG